MSSRSLARWAAALAVPSLALTVGLAPAHATGGDTHTEPIHQTLPRTATDAGVSQEGPEGCPGIKAGQDGWHFVLPGNSTVFTKLTVTFEPGGQQVITDFGPPSDKHAYAFSPAGAKLVAASAETKGEDVEFFNLSHTCPGTPATKPPTTPPATTPPATTPPTSTPATSKPATSEPPATGTTPSSTSTVESSASPSASSSVAPSTVPVASDEDGGGSLAATGGMAVGGILVVAAVLVGGGYLLRRRANTT